MILRKLSSESLHFLERVLDKDVTLGHSIIIQLTGQENQLDHNEALQGLYLRCMQRHIYVMKQLQHCESYEAKSTQMKFTSSLLALCKILALMNPSQEMKSLPLHQIFCDFLDLFDGEESDSLFHLSMIYMALLRADDVFLISCFLKLEDKKRGRVFSDEVCHKDGQKSNSSATRWRHLRTPASPGTWREMYLFCLNQRIHFLEDVMVCFEKHT